MKNFSYIEFREYDRSGMTGEARGMSIDLSGDWMDRAANEFAGIIGGKRRENSAVVDMPDGKYWCI